jgi:DNA-binding beta-propeller fold protein YncE
MCLSVVFAAVVLTVPSMAAEEQTAVIAFDSEDWTITSGRIVDHLGRKALAGSAFLKDVDFTDGVIEVDIAMDGRRCFPGIIFRAESEADTETFYVRPHRSKNYSHALQYAPRFRGLTGWQLFSGPGFTAGVDIPLDRWVHVKIEILGSRARIYFDDMESPALVVGDLSRGTTGGFIGVTARTTIAAERPERRKLLFGYSDEISVFLNGELLFRGDSSFRVRDSEFMGIVGLNDAVVLNLNKGENELLFVVTESFGGWGFMARTESLRTDPILLADGVTKSWELAEGLMMPESAAWDSKRGHFYVSNINPAGPAGYGEQGFISRIDAAGQVLDIGWITGLRGPTGVAVLNDLLYVVERTGVAVIDLDSAEIVQRRPIESEGGFLNDIAVNSDGTLFVSDSSLGAIYRVKDGETELWLRNASIAGANGLVVQGERLIATTMGSECLVSINLETAKIESIVDLRPFGGDGISPFGTDAFLVSDFNGLLLRVTPKGDRDVLVDTRDVGISLTDFAFAPEHALVVVPTLRGNSLMAFNIH